MEIQQQTDRYTPEVREYSTTDFETLFNRFSDMLYHYAFYYLNDMDAAKSVVNDTFIKLWNGKHKPSYIKTYLYKAVKNACLNYLSQRKEPMVLKGFSELETLADSTFSVEQTDALNDQLLFLEKVIAKLPAKRQLVFKMFRFEELSYAEIAELLNISVRTVEDHLSKSMQFIHAQAKHLVDRNLTNT